VGYSDEKTGKRETYYKAGVGTSPCGAGEQRSGVSQRGGNELLLMGGQNLTNKQGKKGEKKEVPERRP